MQSTIHFNITFEICAHRYVNIFLSNMLQNKKITDIKKQVQYPNHTSV